jgi:hypothetical protein
MEVSRGIEAVAERTCTENFESEMMRTTELGKEYWYLRLSIFEG